jgi:signal transduction histidine kinase
MKFLELVDIEELRGLCESFTALTGAVTAILDLEGNILIATGWQDVCTHFHRVHPTSALRCLESDTALAGMLKEGQPYNIYKCKNGLVDVAMPIVIGGEHIANFFTGQFFFEKPDREFFLRQADELCFSRDSYMEALQRAPVFSEDQVRAMTDFFSRLAMLIGKMGLANAETEKANQELRFNQSRIEMLVEERTAELAKANEELRKAMDHLVLVEKLASLGRLVAGMSHELNTPLGNMLMVATTLESRLGAFADQVHSGALQRSVLDGFIEDSLSATRILTRGATYAADLVASFKRVSIDQSSFCRRRFDLAEVVRETLTALQSRLKKTAIEVETDIPEGIVLDNFPGPLEQVLTNLVMNSLLHAFGAEGKGRIRIVARGQGGVLSMIYEDNGRGMSASIAKHAFDPFFTTKLGEGGSGLGLYIVYNLVTVLLNGSVSLTTKPGAGVRFAIAFPLQALAGSSCGGAA